MLDDELKALHAQGALDKIATRALDAYGAELYGFLVYAMGNESEAGEVFSEVGENLWTALRGASPLAGSARGFGPSWSKVAS